MGLYRWISCGGLAAVAILAAAAGPVAAQSTAGRKVVLRGDYWCPYVCTPGSDREGYMVDAAREIFAAAGLAVDFELAPWARTLDGVERGTYDGAVGSVVGERDTLLYGPVSLGSDPTVFAIRRGTGFAYHGPESLHTYRLGAVLGYSYDGGALDDYLTANKDNPRKVMLYSGDDVGHVLVRHLLLGRIDVAVENEFVLRTLAADQSATDRLDYVPLGNASEVSIAFTMAKPEGADYARILSDGVVRLARSGRLKAIMARYGVEVPIPSLPKE